MPIRDGGVLSRTPCKRAHTSGPKFRLVVAICVMPGRAVNILGRWYHS
jgi:hypothetical protein